MQLREALPSRLMKKTCLSCGYHGRALQGERGLSVYQCPACQADLYARPPRSYAEMEGLTEPMSSRPGTGRRLFAMTMEDLEISPAPVTLTRRIGRICRRMLVRLCCPTHHAPRSNRPSRQSVEAS